MIFLRRRSWFLVLGILTSKQMVPATLFSFLLRIQNNFKNLMLDVGLFIFTESHIVKMLKICWFFPIQRCKMQICIQNMYFSLLLWNRCYLLSKRLFQHFSILQYCIKGLVPWGKTIVFQYKNYPMVFQHFSFGHSFKTMKKSCLNKLKFWEASRNN